MHVVAVQERSQVAAEGSQVAAEGSQAGDERLQTRPATAARTVLRAESIGCRVGGMQCGGRVEAVFPNACNVLLRSGSLLTVLARRAGNVAHGIRLSDNPRLDGLLAQGMPVRIAGDCLIFGDGALAVMLSGARAWTPGLRPGICRWDEHSTGAALLLRDLLGEHAAHCESEFLAAVLGVKRPASPLGERVTRILPELALAARAGEREEALTRIARLVGLGPGLTPAGDDFIIGWLAGLALGAGTPAGLEFLHAMCAGVAPLRHQTTVVSRQHLEDSCALMFSERLSDVCVAIAAGAAQAMLAERVAGQLGVGATSGADAAAGLLFALFDCESIYRRCESMPINLGDCDAHIA